MSLEKSDINSARIKDLGRIKRARMRDRKKSTITKDTRDIGRVASISNDTEFDRGEDIGSITRKKYSFKSGIVSHLTKNEYFPSDNFKNYQTDFLFRFNRARDEYKHVEEKELAYWFFCAEAQKRAYLYKNYKEKIDLQIKSFSDSQIEINTPKNKNYQLEIANLLAKHRKDYMAVTIAYYDELMKSVIELNFPSSRTSSLSELNAIYEFSIIDDIAYHINPSDKVISWTLPSELMEYNLSNTETLIDLYNKSKPQIKNRILSALDQNGIVYRKDFSPSQPKNNTHIQPLQILNDNVHVNIDFTLSDNELAKYIKKLKKEFLSLEFNDRVKPSERLKLGVLGLEFDPKMNNVGNIIPIDSSYEKFLKVLFLYDTRLFGCYANEAENLLSSIDENSKKDTHSQTRKKYLNLLSIMTSDWYIKRCDQLKE